MRKIFLDCGGWDGTSISFFKKNYPDADRYKIFCFEPLPENLERLVERYGNDDSVVIIPVAVWSWDGWLKFYKGLTQSGSVYKEKRTGGVNPDNWIDVECIDFGRWVVENIKKDDYVVCKLNVEGAEYDILEKMYRRDMLGLIDKWYVQWHWDKVGVSKDRHDKISKLVKWYEWRAMLNDVDGLKKTL